MSVLDELAREAAAIREREERERARRAAVDVEVRRTLMPRLRAAYDYFRKLKGHIEVLAPRLEATYHVDGLGPLERLIQGEYGLFTDDPLDRLRGFAFRYAYTGRRAVEFTVAHRVALGPLRDRLAGHGLRFAVREALGREAVVRIEPWVPVAFEFAADTDAGRMRLVLRNVGDLGRSVHHFEARRIDRAFVDEIAKCVLHKPHRLTELTGDNLTRTGRFRLQRSVEQERRQREAELARSRTETESERSLTRRFGRTFLGRQ